MKSYILFNFHKIKYCTYLINHRKNVIFSHCSVLDLNAFERQNKAEGLGMVTEEGSGIIDSAEIFHDLF